MKVYSGNRLEDIYQGILKDLTTDGITVSPRGMKTIEFNEPVTINVKIPTHSIVTSKNRKSLLGFYFGEFIWMLAGSNDLEHVANYLKGWRLFSDDGETLNGAYGHRIFKWKSHNGTEINQFQAVYEKLKKDINCRQAVISIYNPSNDIYPTKDTPCNNFIQFYVRNNKLCATVYQRSCDIISGLTYDMFMFSMFQNLMAGRLGLEVGDYTHIANSLHLYEKDFPMASRIICEENISYLKHKKTYDYRIQEEIYEEEINKIIYTESVFRNGKETIDKQMIEDLLSKIKNKAWRSALAIIAITNLRKAGRKEEAFDLYYLVQNEFYELINERWI